MRKICGRKYILKASVLLLAAVLIVSFSAVLANTSEKNTLTLHSPATPITQYIHQSHTQIRQDIIWDNGGTAPGANLYSSQLDAAYPFNSQVADDFILEGDALVTDVHWWGGFWGGTAFDPVDFNIYFYADDGTGNAPTGAGMANPEVTALASYFFAGVTGLPLDPNGFYEYHVDLGDPFPCVAEEKYWLVVQAVFNFPPQWGWANTDGIQLHQAVQGFPELGTEYWTDLDPAVDMAFYLTGETEEPLVADADGPYEGLVGEEIEFSGSATGGIPPYTYSWDLDGDGEEDSTDQNPTFTYDEADVYTVTLTVTDSERAEDTDETTSTITEPPAELEIIAIEGGMGVTATIKNVGDATAENVEWHIIVTGGLLGLIDVDATDVEASLAADAEIAPSTTLGFFHLGPIDIEVTAVADNADEVTETATGFVIGPFVLITG